MSSTNIEIVLKSTSTASNYEIIGICKKYLTDHKCRPGFISHFNRNENFILFEDVNHIIIESSNEDENVPIDFTSINNNWYIYVLDENGPQLEICEDESGGEVNLSTHWILPSLDVFNLWESLIYESDIKENLLKYAHSMMQFSDKGVNSNVISCNRVILLHGPPGTGKTSLCKALAQKLSIRMKNRYKQAVLIEINSHSLFSKWFSESGKLVTMMFKKIREILDVPGTLVCVLIDEVESLAHAREQCMSGNEPSDSIRVVNAVLTQIDQIKRYPNVVILTTSNMTGAIDVAFVDRADVKQFIGLPGLKAIYEIYLSCIHELLRTELVTLKGFDGSPSNLDNEHQEKLMKICQESIGMSGRTLRKIPFLAHALFMSKCDSDLITFFTAMKKAILYEKRQKQHFLSTNNVVNGVN